MSEWLGLARAHRGPLAAFAGLVLVSAFLAAVVPGKLAAAYDRAAAKAIGVDPAPDLRVEGRVQAGRATTVRTAEDLTQQGRSWSSALPPIYREVTGPPEASVTTEQLAVAGQGDPRLLNLSWDSGANGRVRYVAGAPPRGPLEVGIARKAAGRLRLTAGSVLDTGLLRLRVTGLYEPRDPGDPYWAARRAMLESQVVTGNDGLVADRTTGLLNATGFEALYHQAPELWLTYSWRMPIRTGEVTAGRTAPLIAGLETYRTTVQARNDLVDSKVVTMLDGRLRDFAERLRVTRAILGPALSGLAAVAAGVLLLGGGMVGAGLRPVLATMRARGASVRRLLVVAGGVTGMAVLPAAVLGWAVVWRDASPGNVVAVVVMALAPPLFLALRTPVWPGPRRADLVAVRAGARRLAAEGLLVVLAVAGLVLLRRRGPAQGADPYLAAVPVLLAAAAGLLLLRGYPYPLRLLARILRRRRSAVGYLGVARASRQRLVAALPLVVLLLATAVAGFSGTVRAELERGWERAAWHEVGGDAMVSYDHLDPGVTRRIQGLPAVTAAVPARVITDAWLGSTPVAVVAVDLAAYRRIAGDRVPDAPRDPYGAYFSPAADRPGGETLSWAGGTAAVRRAGRIEGFPGLRPGAPFVVIPYGRLAGAEAHPSVVFVQGDPDPAALRAAARQGIPPMAIRLGLGEVVVETYQGVYGRLADAPLAGVVAGAFRAAAAVAVGFGLLTILLVLVDGARERAGTVGRLRLLGMSGRQARLLALVEHAPLIVAAVGAGWSLGLLLPRMVGPAVDLHPYTGGFLGLGI